MVQINFCLIFPRFLGEIRWCPSTFVRSVYMISLKAVLPLARHINEFPPVNSHYLLPDFFLVKFVHERSARNAAEHRRFSWKSGAGRDVLRLRMCRETALHFVSKERLAEVCILLCWLSSILNLTHLYFYGIGAKRRVTSSCFFFLLVLSLKFVFL